MIGGSLLMTCLSSSSPSSSCSTHVMMGGGGEWRRMRGPQWCVPTRFFTSFTFSTTVILLAVQISQFSRYFCKSTKQHIQQYMQDTTLCEYKYSGTSILRTLWDLNFSLITEVYSLRGHLIHYSATLGHRMVSLL